MSEAAKALVTAEELIRMPSDFRCELIHGEVIPLEWETFEHSRLLSRFWSLVAVRAWDEGVGEVYGCGMGIILARDPDTVRSPDGAFYRKDRAPVGLDGYPSTMPDLVLEVASVADNPRYQVEKVLDWLEAGAGIVWLLWIEPQVVQVWRSIGDVTVFHATDTLTCEDLLQGFALPLERVFG